MAGKPPRSAVSAVQLELPIGRERVADRHADKGGRSFYFFDFDDNVMVLQTRIFVFNRSSGEEVVLSTRELAHVSRQLGQPGPWECFELRLDDRTGSFRSFRDFPQEVGQGAAQPFVEDMAATLGQRESSWRGPSWGLFDHAVFNERAIAIITARGHHPDTIREGISLLCENGHLSGEPNYLGIYAVSHPKVRAQLGDPEAKKSIPELKKAAIVAAVDRAMQLYGENPYHRFGMSDDDSANVALIVEAMKELKERFPENAFFVIDTSQRPVTMTEVFVERTEVCAVEQLTLFDLI